MPSAALTPLRYFQHPNGGISLLVLAFWLTFTNESEENGSTRIELNLSVYFSLRERGLYLLGHIILELCPATASLSLTLKRHRDVYESSSRGFLVEFVRPLTEHRSPRSRVGL